MYKKISDRFCFEKDDIPFSFSENAGADKASVIPDPENLGKTPASGGRKGGLLIASIVVAVITAVAFIPLAAIASSLFPPILKGGAGNLGEGLGLIILIPLYFMCSIVVAATSIAGVVLSVSGLRKSTGGRRIWFLCDLIFSALLLTLTVAGIVILLVNSAENGNTEAAALAASLAAL